MNDEDAKAYRDMTLRIYRQIHHLRAAHEALLMMVVESFPESERVAALHRFQKFQDKVSQDILLKLEESSPNFAAELDILRPLIHPDDET